MMRKKKSERVAAEKENRRKKAMEESGSEKNEHKKNLPRLYKKQKDTNKPNDQIEIN